MTDKSTQTHFGYQSVDEKQKESLVASVFTSVANQYDVMNDLMSLGVHRLWKRYAINLCQLRKGHHVLDLAGGTGDLTALMSPKVGDEGEVILSDINHAMMEVGRGKLLDKGIVSNVKFVQANAEQLPFADNQFDCVTMAFGLRNVTHKDQALKQMYRVIKPGGKIIILEFSKPILPLLSKAYDAYSFSVLPALGQLIANDADSYRYLAESIRMHPDQDTLQQMMLDAGCDHADYHNLTGGIVAVHRGYKY